MEGPSYRRENNPYGSNYADFGNNAKAINSSRNGTNSPVHPGVHPPVHGQPLIPSQEVLLKPNMLHAVPQSSTTNVTTNIQAPNDPTLLPVPVGPDPMRMRCYHCGADIKTATTTTHKDTAHICCLMTGSATCCLCFWIPYCCCKSFQKVDHKCPCCGSYLGTYNG